MQGNKHLEVPALAVVLQLKKRVSRTYCLHERTENTFKYLHALLMQHEKLRHLVAEPAQRICNNGVQSNVARSKSRICVVLATTVQSCGPVSQMQVIILFVDELKTDTPKV